MNNNTKSLLKACELAESRAGEKGNWFPSFHLAPVTGWMNDPNGLCEFNGVHHIFFQYSPFDTSPGMNYWGHFSTKNFVDIKYHKPALCCDEKFDCHGVYSGSAFCDETGMNIFYTGNVLKSGEKEKEYDYLNTGREHNTVFVNSKDGLTFDGKTVVLKNSDYPKTALVMFVIRKSGRKTENIICCLVQEGMMMLVKQFYIHRKTSLTGNI